MALVNSLNEPFLDLDANFFKSLKQRGTELSPQWWADMGGSLGPLFENQLQFAVADIINRGESKS